MYTIINVWVMDRKKSSCYDVHCGCEFNIIFNSFESIK